MSQQARKSNNSMSVVANRVRCHIQAWGCRRHAYLNRTSRVESLIPNERSPGSHAPAATLM